MIEFAVWSPDEATFWQSWEQAGIIAYGEDGRRYFTAEYPGVIVSDQASQGWTPTRATGELDGEGNPIFEAVPGWHCNVRVDGPLVAEMTYGLDQTDAEGVLKNVFDRTWAVQIFLLEWREADPTTGFPAGYRNSTGVHYADVRDLSSPTNRWL